jgi:hypothetical protein
MLLAVDKAISKVFGAIKDKDSADKVQKDAKASIVSLMPKGYEDRLRAVEMSGMGEESKGRVKSALSAGKSLDDAIADLPLAETLALIKQALWTQSHQDVGDVASNVSGLALAPTLAGYISGGVGNNIAPSTADAEKAAARNVGTAPTPEGAAPAVTAPMTSSAPTPEGAAPAVTAPMTSSAPSSVNAPVISDPVTADLLDISGRENVQSLQNLYDALRSRGIIIDKAQLSGPIKDTIRMGTLDAFREALFEQAIYSSPDSAALLGRMKESGFSGVANMASKYEELRPTATGGTVVGIAGGRAVIAARGEGLASVGKGEKIVPSGGGNGGITVNVNGIGGADLANHLKKKIAEGIYEYKRREKFQ